MASNGPEGIRRIPELEGHYEIVRELGQGGTSVVYLARDLRLGRDVAIKLIRPAYTGSEDALARLVREARTVGRLQHPNIIMLLDTRPLSDGSLALILQFAPGVTLKERIRSEGPLPFEEVEQVLRNLAQALGYAHHQRIVHRDVKPENVYLDDEAGVARLADFGIARPWDSDSGLTLPGTAIGTPTYMSPEQVDGQSLDGRSDLYSLGLVGWEMLTGRQPWEGESLYNIIYKQKNEELSPLDQLREGVPENLKRAVEGALAKAPAQRWSDAEAFLQCLGMSSEELMGSTPPVQVPDTTDVPRSGARTWATRLAAAVVLVGGVLIPSGPERYAESILGFLSPSATTTNVDLQPAPSGGGEVAPILPRLQEPTGVPDPGADTSPETVSAESGEDAAGLPSDVRLVTAGGDGQEGSPGSNLSETLDVRVEDPDGSPVAGVQVTFHVASGGGTVDPGAVETDGQGMARTLWTLGGSEGVQQVEARISGDQDEVAALFHAQASRPSLPVNAGVVTGGLHSCRLLPSGEVLCWGANDNGQLGLEGQGRLLGPSGRVDREVFAVVAPGVGHTCALDMEGWALCWGQNSHGQLGNEAAAAVRLPARVASDLRFSTVQAGADHTCALTPAGAAYCWGGNTHGQLGDDSRTDRAEPVEVAGVFSFRTLATGWSHTCALDGQGRAHCWGRNSSGELGVGDDRDRVRPNRVSGGHDFTAIAAGNAHTCGVSVQGQVHCWGANESGQLGDGTTADSQTPVAVDDDQRFVQVAAGGVHTCAVTSEGHAYCWGRNVYGQLGDGTAQDRTSPTPVEGDLRFRSLHSKGSHTCGETRDGSVYCWGYNTEGQLGDGTRQNRLRPTPIDGEGE